MFMFAWISVTGRAFVLLKGVQTSQEHSCVMPEKPAACATNGERPVITVSYRRAISYKARIQIPWASCIALPNGLIHWYHNNWFLVHNVLQRTVSGQQVRRKKLITDLLPDQPPRPVRTCAIISACLAAVKTSAADFPALQTRYVPRQESTNSALPPTDTRPHLARHVKLRQETAAR